MTLKRALWCVFWLFLIFFVVSDPQRAATVAQGIGCTLRDWADQVAVFLGNLNSSSPA